MSIDRIIELLPKHINHKLRGTFVENVYNEIEKIRYKHFVSFKEYNFSSPVGEITLDIPTTGPWNRFGEVYANTPYGHEPVLVTDLAKESSPGTVFYDVGSQHGYISKAAQRTGIRPTNIYALESHSGLAYVTSQNCPQIKVSQVRVGSQANSVKTTLD